VVGLDQKVPLGVQVAVADEIRDARRFGGHNWLLDMTPENNTKTDVALPVGRPYADPDPMGPKFTVLSADATKAVISVDLGDGMIARPGAGTCDDGSAFTAPGPDLCAAGPPTPPAPDGGAPALARDAGGVVDATPPADSRGADDVGPAAPEAGGSGRADGARPGSEAEADTRPGPTGAGGKGGGGGQTGGTVRGGCSCRLAAGPDSGPLAAPAALAIVLTVLRRRRLRSRR